MILIALYLINIAIDAHFGIIDDHTLLKTLFVGEWIPLFIHPQIGRFYPLDAFDLNILSTIFAPSASVFYAFNAVLALVLIFALYKSLSIITNAHSTRDSAYRLAWILVVLLSPAMITAFLRLFVPERLEVVFFALFMLCFVAFSRDNRAHWIVLGALAANVALYCKEVAFIALGSFAFFHFIFAFRTSSLKSKLFDAILMLSCALWLVAYYVLVISVKTTSGRYGDTPYNTLLVFAKNALNYTLSEPFLFLGVAGILAFRIYLVAWRKERVNPLLDSALLAATLHHFAYFTLNIYSPHYPLPSYIFAILPLAVYFRAYVKSLFIKLLFVLCAILWLANALPYAIYQFNYYKAVPANFQATLGFLDGYLAENPRTNIYLEGVNRASGVEVHHSFAAYLTYMGHSEFDLRSDMGIDNTLLFKADESSKYSVFRADSVLPKQSGDIAILTPFTLRGAFDAENYELIFESKRGFNLPHLGLKTLLKYYAIRENPDLALSHNVFALPIHFSVYRVK